MSRLAELCSLNPGHCAMLTEAIQKCHDLQCILEGLRQAGYPVEDKAHEIASLRQQAENLKRTFFPGEN